SAEWRDQEKAAGLVLGPDEFQIPTTGGTGAESDPWRAPAAQRGDWQRRLRSRIAARQEQIDALAATVSDLEEEVLLPLRDALVAASGAPGAGIQEQADWISVNLLIDARTDGCAVTTRVRQAIETLQALMLTLRLSQLEDNFKTFSLDADHFDDEWKWLGAYSSWHSAMQVFLYPENLLQPSVRPVATADFTSVVAATRSQDPFTPADACAQAHSYASYF